MIDSVCASVEEGVAVLRFDDGKANVISPASLEALDAGLDRAEKEAGAALLIGRTGRFSAGFDLGTLRQGGEAARNLVHGGARLLLRMAEAPIPVVAACSGHALGMGALLLLASDLRVGARGPFKIGLNEVGIGMVLPGFAVGLARERLSLRHLGRAANLAEIYDADGAADAGFLDQVVAPELLEEVAQERATRLAALPRGAFSETKRRLRGFMLEQVRSGLEADMASWQIH